MPDRTRRRPLTGGGRAARQSACAQQPAPPGRGEFPARTTPVRRGPIVERSGVGTRLVLRARRRRPKTRTMLRVNVSVSRSRTAATPGCRCASLRQRRLSPTMDLARRLGDREATRVRHHAERSRRSRDVTWARGPPALRSIISVATDSPIGDRPQQDSAPSPFVLAASSPRSVRTGADRRGRRGGMTAGVQHPNHLQRHRPAFRPRTALRSAARRLRGRRTVLPDWTQPLVFSRGRSEGALLPNQYVFRPSTARRRGRRSARISGAPTPAFRRISTQRPPPRWIATAGAASSTRSRRRRSPRRRCGSGPMTA